MNMQAFAGAVRSRRGDRPLSEVASVTGISAATLSRVENGKLPDMTTFTALCRWLGGSPERFFEPYHGGNVPIWTAVGALLHGDRVLDARLIMAIERLIVVLYDAAVTKGAL